MRSANLWSEGEGDDAEAPKEEAGGLMRIGNVLLPLLAVGALAMGVAAQRPQKKEPPLAKTLFAKATADDFLGEETCAGCHGEVVEKFKGSGHASYMYNEKAPLNKQGCEGCHGPGKFHLDEENPQIIAFKQLNAREIDAACLRCHEDVMSEASWSHTDHAKADVSCISCHQIHPSEHANATDEKLPNASKGVVKSKVFPSAKPAKSLLKNDEATLCGSCHANVTNQFRQNSHHPLPEGRVTCSDCHDVHEMRGSKQGTGLKDSTGFRNRSVSLGQKCAKCHQDKVGPFTFEHDAVNGFLGDGCLECHKPHGSQNPRLLNAFSRGLCAQCHTDKMRNHFPGRTCWSASCHVSVHGSHTDPNLLRP